MRINKCEICFKEFKSRKALSDHIFHSKLVDNKHIDQKIKLREKRFEGAKKKCFVCGQKIFRNIGLHLTRSEDNDHIKFYNKQSNFVVNLFKEFNSFEDITLIDNKFCRDYPSKHFAKICLENLGRKKVLKISKKIISVKKEKYWKSINLNDRKNIMKKVRDAEWGELTKEQRKKHPWVIAGRKASLKSSIRGSKNQQYAFKLLRQKIPEFNWEYNYTIEDNWHVDIASPENSLYIEWDGRHHFVPIHGDNYLNNRINRDEIKNKLVLNRLNSCMIRIKDGGRENKKFVEYKITEIFNIIKKDIPLGELIQL